MSILAADGCLAQVVLRDGKGELGGTIVEIAPSGVSVDVAADGRTSRRVVGWDRIKQVEGAQSTDSRALSAPAIALWRVRTRLERGDWLGAEPLLSEVLGAFQGRGGPSEVVACDAALRCRVSRGARAGAVAAWLDLLGAYERSGAIGTSGAGPTVAVPSAWVGGVIEALPAMDLGTGLVPSLPPIWVGEPAMDVAAAAGEWSRPSKDTKVQLAAELSAWYVAAARFEASGGSDRGDWPAAPSSAGGERVGTRLVRLIVQARAGDATQRATARESLRAVMSADAAEAWHEAWCRAAIGRSLLREPEPEQRIAGVIELLHVPARLSGASPYLSGVCLAEAAVAMWDVGDKQAAAALRSELLARHPGHPAAGWGRLAEIVAPAPASVPVASEPKDLPAAPKLERRGR